MRPPLHVRLLDLWDLLCRDRRGSTAMTFGLMLVPILLAAGAGLDYSRATNVRAGLQVAVDAAVLGVARDGSTIGKTSTVADIEKRVRDGFYANYSKAEGAVKDTDLDIVVDTNKRTVKLTARARVDTTLMRLASVQDMTVSSSAIASWDRNTIELAMALDNTGSMSSSGKMGALKTAVNNLLNTMESASKGDPSLIKISMVPFNSQVKIAPADVKSLGLFSIMDAALNLVGLGGGCVGDRDQPNDANVLNVGSILYPIFSCRSTIAKSIPLTNDYAKLRAAVTAMQPNGNTNVSIGAVWGHTTLDPNGPLSGAKPFGTDRLLKYLIVMTDGVNTQNRWDNCGSDTNCVKKINARTLAACTDAKNKGITVYSILVLENNSLAVDTMQKCASDAGKFKYVANANDLDPVFRDIANQILGVRLTN